MADTYEKDLAQKSSLTVSDYIRMVGSDNVSYKQGARSVAELMSTALPYSTVTEVLTWAEGINGRGITYTANSTTDLPTEQAIKYGVAWTYNYMSGSSVWLNVFWSPNNRAEIYYNTKTGTNAWLGWQKMPTRAEIDDAHRYKGAVTVSDFNSLTETGIYFAKGTNTTPTLNPPIPSNPGRYYQLLVTNADGMITQFATSHNDPNTIYSRDSVGGSTWTAWTKQPTRAEVGVREKTVTGTTSNYGTINLSLPLATNEIVSVCASVGNYYCIPVQMSGGTYAKVFKDSDDTRLTNTEVTLTVRYRTYTSI